MAGDLVYAFRVMRLPLLDAGGSQIGRIADLVAIPGRPARAGQPALAPRIVGFVADSQRRRIFVGANRMGELTSEGARLRSWDVDLNPFKRRAGEVLIGEELLDRRIGDEVVTDIGLVHRTDGRSSWWEIEKVRLARKGSIGRRPSYRLVDYDEVPALFGAPSEMQAEAARLRDFHPAEVAAIVRALPDTQRRQLAEAMDDERLADVLEELPEEDQVEILEHLDSERAADVLEEMSADDAADLIADLNPETAATLLGLMEPEEAEDVRRLMSYADNTAGAMMTPEPVILSPDATIADALAHVRNPELTPSLAALVYVCRQPLETPTGRLLGAAHIQRLLREPPSTLVAAALDDSMDPLRPDATLDEVAAHLATYNLVAAPVVDDEGRLIGAVTVDDLLDHMLPEGWRDRAPRPGPITGGAR
jgi:CBS domain-containing protein